MPKVTARKQNWDINPGMSGSSSEFSRNPVVGEGVSAKQITDVIPRGLTRKQLTSMNRTVGMPPKVTPWSTVLFLAEL